MLISHGNNSSVPPIVHRSEKRNYACKRAVRHKIQIQTAAFASTTQRVVAASDTLPTRSISCCCFATCCGWVMLITSTASPSRDWTDSKVATPSQASRPSVHVWPNCVSPTSPQFLNQAPPRPQQLLLPALLVAHLAHPLLLLAADKRIVVRASVGNECADIC